MTKCKSTLDSGCSFVQNQISNLRSSGLTASSILSAPRRLLAFWWDIAVVRKTSCPRRSLATGCRGKEKKKAKHSPMCVTARVGEHLGQFASVKLGVLENTFGITQQCF